ncbi:MAG: tellurite resistance/C4-dicarboxylate transporter family protein, partial [Solirubrobacteraceae bacterium]
EELIAPGAGGVVMGTGIVSVGLATTGAGVLSKILLALASLAWAILTATAGYRLGFRRQRFLAEATSPAGLTGVAGTAVLGTRFAQLGWSTVGDVLLILAVVAGAALAPAVLRHLPRRTSGQVFMVTVAVESVSSLAAHAALDHRLAWLAYLALVLTGGGILPYPFLLTRFRLADVALGRGDQWVAGGSLAICSLAASVAARNAHRLAAPAGGTTALHDVALGLWIAAALWIVPLVAGELRRPRRGYGTRRWATVFPLGMYAVSAFSLAGSLGATGLRDFARAWIWIAVAAWAATLLGMVQSGWRRWAETAPSRVSYESTDMLHRVAHSATGLADQPGHAQQHDHRPDDTQ